MQHQVIAPSRPYDPFIPHKQLLAVQARRQDPDGEYHELQTMFRGGVEVYIYPWHKMELGDFFIVPATVKEKSFRIMVNQVAKRRNIELVVKKVLFPDHSPGFRVTLTMFGVDRPRELYRANEERRRNAA